MLLRRIPYLAAAAGLASVGWLAFGPLPGAATASPTNGCHATITVSGSTATATPIDCGDQSWTVSSWSLPSFPSNAGETLFDRVSSPATSVDLPGCGWQVDFRPTGASHVHGSAKGTGTDCQTTTTTVAPTTTTTVAPTTSTTATTAPATTTTTAPPVVTPTTQPEASTPATVTPITAPAQPAPGCPAQDPQCPSSGRGLG